MKPYIFTAKKCELESIPKTCLKNAFLRYNNNNNRWYISISDFRIAVEQTNFDI